MTHDKKPLYIISWWFMLMGNSSHIRIIMDETSLAKMLTADHCDGSRHPKPNTEPSWSLQSQADPIIQWFKSFKFPDLMKMIETVCFSGNPINLLLMSDFSVWVCGSSPSTHKQMLQYQLFSSGHFSPSFPQQETWSKIEIKTQKPGSWGIYVLDLVTNARVPVLKCRSLELVVPWHFFQIRWQTGWLNLKTLLLGKNFGCFFCVYVLVKLFRGLLKLIWPHDRRQSYLMTWGKSETPGDSRVSFSITCDQLRPVFLRLQNWVI